MLHQIRSFHIRSLKKRMRLQLFRYLVGHSLTMYYTQCHCTRQRTWRMLPNSLLAHIRVHAWACAPPSWVGNQRIPVGRTSVNADAGEEGQRTKGTTWTSDRKSYSPISCNAAGRSNCLAQCGERRQARSSPSRRETRNGERAEQRWAVRTNSLS